MKKLILLLIITLSQTTLADIGGGDGTLPVIRNINIEIEAGNLQRELNIPTCIDLKVSPEDFRSKKRMRKTLRLNDNHLKQDIEIQKVNGVIELNVETRNQGTARLDTQILAVSETEFHNTIQFGQNSLNQTIQINSQGRNCVKR